MLGWPRANIAEGRTLAAEMIASGRARDTFREVIRLQGGDPRSGRRSEPLLPRAQTHGASEIAARRIRHARFTASKLASPACCSAEAARRKKTRWIRAVGLVLEKKIGDAVEGRRESLHRALQLWMRAWSHAMRAVVRQFRNRRRAAATPRR